MGGLCSQNLLSVYGRPIYQPKEKTLPDALAVLRRRFGQKTDTGKPEVAKMFLVISLIRSFFDADYASDVRLKNVGENNPFFGF